MGTPLSFWFELASTYSYPAAEQVRQIVACGAAKVLFRPFLLGPIFKRQGWNTSPFNLYPEKGEYMWQDVARRCDMLDLPFQRPEVFPQPTLLVARMCTALNGQPQLPAIICDLYRQNFAYGGDLSDPGCLGAVLTAHGLDPDEWLSRAQTQDVKQALRASGEEAERLGIFGAPSFTSAGQLFWGEDRLQQALGHASAPCALPGIELYPFQRNDQAAVVALWQESGLVVPHNDPDKDIRIRSRAQPQLFLVAKAASQVIGTCMAGFDGHRGWLNLLAVNPQHRKRGIGAALVAAAEARLRALGCSKVNLQVRGGNDGVLTFYRRLGFQEEDRHSLGKRLAAVS